MKRIVTATIAALSLTSTISLAEPQIPDEYADALSSANDIDDSEIYNEYLSADTESLKGRKGFGACAKLNLDETQKSELKNTMFEYKKEMIDLKANMKKSYLDYAGLVLNMGSSKGKNLSEVSQNILSAKSQIAEQKLNLKNKILFDILNEDQKKAGFMCMLQIKR